MSVQAPSSVVMIRPNRFQPNPETEADNRFQSRPDQSADAVAAAAHTEFDAAVEILQTAGVKVHVFQDERDDTPDSVFPNNWFSTHSGGHVAIYPMFAASRRRERRSDVIELLKRDYRVQTVTDYSGLEQDGLSLEGTGAMVLDHIGRIAYVARSHRADPVLLERFCTNFGYEPMVFDATDASGAPVYHTNVLMAVGTHVAMIGSDMIADAARRNEIHARLAETGRDVISLSEHQIGEFAGNAIELSTPGGLILALSARALRALGAEQVQILERSLRLVPLSIPTLETAGGSVRCMLAGLHLARRTPKQG
ncbi:citrulline utilization hydrolase CtlX [Roseovarius pelagicus]|uniref:Arginine deiminase-related protein n=1 Tax=Roseovarius pelagicus TaxID=2980108 RepID=A0ABY6DEV4_9RHOB|nr:arginine deiminase-related protein [Roseovarius pelagicus]UXX83763.1 arginine deiminase-related protein [Roseovarius pelagicus]